MKLHRYLKRTGMAFGVLLLLMIVAVALINWLGALLSGGTDEFLGFIQRASVPLLLFRLAVYAVVTVIGVKTYRIHKAASNQEGMTHLKRLLVFFYCVVAFIEVPTLFGS